MKPNKNNSNNSSENGLTKSELRKKLASEASQKLELNKNFSNQNSILNESISIRMENTLISSSPSSTSPFSSFTNSSSSSSSEDNYVNMKQNKVQNQENETDYNSKYLGMGMSPFSLLNGHEKMYAQSTGFNSNIKLSKYICFFLKFKF